MSFPEGFWWGSGLSSAGSDGPAPASDLAAFLAEGGRTAPPTGSAGGETGGPGGNGLGGNGFAMSYPDDLQLLADHGLDHVRLTLEWARLEPADGRRDPDAVEQARLVLEAAREAGLSVWACLHDGSLPGWFSHDERGYADARSRRYLWSRHVEFMGETFGDLVHGWVPVFEPSRWATRGWLDGTGPPGRRDDAKGFAAALEGAHLATVEAALRLREDGHPVASAQWLVPLFPARDHPDAPVTPQAEAACSVVDETLRRSWLRMLDEESLVIPGRSPVAVPGARQAFDVIGFTYRHGLAVQGDGALLPYPQTLATGDDGQVPWTVGLGLVLHRLAEALPERPLLLAGFGLTTSDEDRREQYLRDGLAVAREAVEGGIPLRGLWWNTPIGAASGLFDPDRAARPAATLLSSVAHGADLPS